MFVSDRRWPQLGWPAHGPWVEPVQLCSDDESFNTRHSLSLQLIFMIETFELLLKSCEQCDLLFVHIQCATACSLEKVNFKV